MDEIYITSGLDLSAQTITQSLTSNLSGVSGALVAFAIASAVCAVLITVVRFFITGTGQVDKAPAALTRIVRISLLASAIAFLGYFGLDLACSLGWAGM